MTILRKTICMCLVSIMCICTFSNVAFAMENETKEMQSTYEQARSTNGFVWKTNTSSLTVTLSKDAKINSTTKSYTGVLSKGNSGVYVFNFKNNSTNTVYSLSFVCDGGTYNEKMGVTLPSGTYTVTLRVSPSNCTLSQLTCNFVN